MSETHFEQYLTERGYVFETQPKIPQRKTKKLDNRVSFDGSDVYFEVKEFEEDDCHPNGAFDPYKRIYWKVKKSRAQLYDYREYSCSLVLYNGTAAPVFLEPEFVLGAMLGTLSYITDEESKLTYKVFSEPGGFRTGHMFDYVNNRPRSSQFSAVIVLEEFPLGQIKLSPLLDQRREQRRKELSTVEAAVDAWNFIQTLKSEGFDSSEKVLRVVVYENPYARILLPRGLFQGPYDERWGSEQPGSLELVFEGSSLQELDAARRSYSESPLMKRLAS